MHDYPNHKTLVVVVILLCFTIFFLNILYTNNVKKTDIGTEPIISILLYHHIVDDTSYKTYYNGNQSVITYSNFKNQMQYLYKNNIKVINSKILYDYLNNTCSLTGKNVLITFDDGYFSNFKFAYPLFKEYNFTGDIFVETSKILDNSSILPNEQLIQRFDFDTINNSSDIFTFYSHTHNLHKLINKISALSIINNASIKNDLLKSISYNCINDLAFAYPYGSYNQNLISILKSSGISMAYTVKPGHISKNSANIYALNRYIIHEGTSIFDFMNIVNGYK